MAQTDSLSATQLGRLVAAPYDALLPWEKALATGFISRMAEDLDDDDVDAVIANWRALPTNGPVSYVTHVLLPAHEEGAVGQETYAAWARALSPAPRRAGVRLRPATRGLAADPRVSLFSARRQQTLLAWFMMLSEQAEKLSVFLGVSPDTLSVTAVENASWRPVWVVNGTLYLVHGPNDRWAAALRYIANNPLAGLEYPLAISKVSGIPVDELTALAQVSDEDLDAAERALVARLEAADVSVERYARAVLDATTDWIPYLTHRIAADGVEHDLGAGWSIVEVLELAPEIMSDPTDGDDDDDDPDGAEGPGFYFG